MVSNPGPLMPEEVFRAFWGLCIAIADMAHTYNLSNEDGLHCAWRRHSLVVSFRYRNSICELSVHRRKHTAICTSSLRKRSIWQSELVQIENESLGFVLGGEIVKISTAADHLFKAIVSYSRQIRGVAPVETLQNI